MLVPSLLFPTIPLEQVRTQPKLHGPVNRGSKSGPRVGGSGSSAASHPVVEDQPPEILPGDSTSTSLDTSTVSLSDEEYEAMGEKEDTLSEMKMEV